MDPGTTLLSLFLYLSPSLFLSPSLPLPSFHCVREKHQQKEHYVMNKRPNSAALNRWGIGEILRTRSGGEREQHRVLSLVASRGWFVGLFCPLFLGAAVFFPCIGRSLCVLLQDQTEAEVWLGR